MKKFHVLSLIALSALLTVSTAQARIYQLSGTILVRTSFAPTVTQGGYTYFSVYDYYKLAYAQIDNDVAEYLNGAKASPVLEQLMTIEKDLSAEKLGQGAAEALTSDELVGLVMARSKTVQTQN